ncbi:MAG TPA: IgGFc-binding protein, partial [bacterium]|nr:IgGFc-binding protein [bacterium]
MRFRFYSQLCLSVLAACAVLVLASGASASPVSNQGTEFWLTFPTQYLVTPQTLYLFILSQNNASGQVSVPALSYAQPFSVAANSAVTLVVPSGAMLTTLDGVQDLGIHVTADNNISVFGLEYELYATDGYLALPVGAIGTNYWVASYTADVGQGAATAIGTSEFAVVASQDSTSVTITPAITVGAHTAGVAYTVALNHGQAYQLQAENLTNDLTGTQVAANNPVALFGANGCADVPVSYTTCNMVLEQELPVSTWGTAFVTVPLAGRSSDTFRYLSATNGTVVSVNGSAAVTLNQYGFFEQMLSAASYITATAPILVMQYSNSHSYDGALYGGIAMADPSELTVPPITDYGTTYQTVAPSS